MRTQNFSSLRKKSYLAPYPPSTPRIKNPLIFKRRRHTSCYHPYLTPIEHNIKVHEKYPLISISIPNQKRKLYDFQSVFQPFKKFKMSDFSSILSPPPSPNLLTLNAPQSPPPPSPPQQNFTRECNWVDSEESIPDPEENVELVKATEDPCLSLRERARARRGPIFIVSRLELQPNRDYLKKMSSHDSHRL